MYGILKQICFYFMGVGVRMYVCMYVYHSCVVATEARRGVRDGYELSCGFWEEHPVLLTADLDFKHNSFYYMLYLS